MKVCREGQAREKGEKLFKIHRRCYIASEGTAHAFDFVFFPTARSKDGGYISHFPITSAISFIDMDEWIEEIE